MRLLTILFAILLTLSGCSLFPFKPYKMEIQQGNIVTSKMLMQLRPGMTKAQVRYVMGTPLIVDEFHGNRWDYYYLLRQAGQVVEQKRVILAFDNEALQSVRGDVMPVSQGVVKLTPAAEVVVPRMISKKDLSGETFWDKLKFWGGDDDSAVPATVETLPASKLPAVPIQNPASASPVSSIVAPVVVAEIIAFGADEASVSNN